MNILPYFTVNMILVYVQLFHVFPHSLQLLFEKRQKQLKHNALRTVAPIPEVSEALIKSKNDNTQSLQHKLKVCLTARLCN